MEEGGGIMEEMQFLFSSHEIAYRIDPRMHVGINRTDNVISEPKIYRINYNHSNVGMCCYTYSCARHRSWKIIIKVTESTSIGG